jgi:hypothetical protein
MTPLGTLSVATAVTTSDTVDFTQGITRALYIGVTGDVTAVVGGAAVLFKAVPVGLLWIGASRVNATATTATNMVALY